MELELASKGHQGAHEVGGRAQGEWRAPTLVDRVWAPWMPSDTNSNSIYLLSERKNQREEIIAFYETEPPPSPKTSREG